MLHGTRLLLRGMMALTLQSFWLMAAVLHRRVHDMKAAGPPVYGWVTERCDTAAVPEAQAVLDGLPERR